MKASQDSIHHSEAMAHRLPRGRSVRPVARFAPAPVRSLILAAVALSLPGTAAWSASTATKSGGDWFESSTWTSGIPAGADSATISGGHTVSVNRVGAGAYFLYNDGSVDVKSSGPPPATLSVVQKIWVGYSSFGQVTLTSGGRVVSGNTQVGSYTSTASGLVTIDGAPTLDGDRATWVDTGQFLVGGSGASAGAGIVMLMNGGLVSTHDAAISIGASTGGVDINNATWTNTNLFKVGDGGTLGELIIRNGGLLKTKTGAIGYGSGSADSLTDTVGTATIEKATWQNSGDFFVGAYAQARLKVQSGSLVTSTTGYVGYGSSSVGSANFSKSTWTNSGPLFVGYYGEGTLVLNDGSSLTSASAILGRYDKSKGAVTVDNASWHNAGDLFVGHGVTGLPNTHTTGQLIVRNGGSLTSATGFIGYGAGSSGSVEVKGMNAAGSASTWDAGALLQVGDRGSALLTISDGGLVKAGSTEIGPGGSLHLNGTNDRRGVLETGRLVSAGGQVYVDGGVLRASVDQARILQSVGLVTVLEGGLSVDSNAHNIGVDTTLTGPGGLTKLGAGTMDLRGNSFLGSLSTVAAGKLLVNGRFSGDVQVDAGATLGGSGQVVGAVRVLAGGSLSPGNSPGTLRLGPLMLDAGSHLHIELGAVSDRLIVDGDLTLGGVIDFFGDPSLFAAGALPAFITYSGKLQDEGLVIGLLPDGVDRQRLALDFSEPGTVGIGLVTVPSVPEPSAAVLLAFGGLVLAAWVNLRSRGPRGSRRRGRAPVGRCVM